VSIIPVLQDTLFPYIRSNLESYLKAHWNDAEFQDDLLLLKEQVSYAYTDFKTVGVIILCHN
jgi:methionine salvage enolase-phosphatase E1